MKKKLNYFPKRFIISLTSYRPGTKCLLCAEREMPITYKESLNNFFPLFTKSNQMGTLKTQSMNFWFASQLLSFGIKMIIYSFYVDSDVVLIRFYEMSFTVSPISGKIACKHYTITKPKWIGVSKLFYRHQRSAVKYFSYSTESKRWSLCR